MYITTAKSPSLELQKLGRIQEGIYGLSIAFTILSVWSISLYLLLHLDLSALPGAAILILVPVLIGQVFLCTGLFITAHDAMHGAVFPHQRKINDAIGILTLLLHSCLPYKKLLLKHGFHHRYPASDRDPDFHDGHHPQPLAWYVQFMKGYFCWEQIIGMTLVHSILRFGFQVSEINLILFWIIPPILSSVQLFYFGTFLTHREPSGGYTNNHRTQTSPFSPFWSFITCYHFGYHLEHHQYPNVPWWRLWAVYKLQNQVLSEAPEAV